MACPECRAQCQVSKAAQNVDLSRVIDNANRAQTHKPKKRKQSDSHYSAARGVFEFACACLSCADFLCSSGMPILSDVDEKLDEQNAVQLVKRLRFSTGLARTVIQQEKRTGMRIFIVDNVVCVSIIVMSMPAVVADFQLHNAVGIYKYTRWLCHADGVDITSQSKTEECAEVG